MATPCRTTTPVPPTSAFRSFGASQKRKATIDLELEVSADEADSDVVAATDRDHDSDSDYPLDGKDGPLVNMNQVPDIDDRRAARPKAGEVRLSQAAISARLRRVMKPNRHGDYKVSEAVVKDFNAAKNRKTIQQIFQMCGYDPDRVAKLFWAMWHVV